MFTSVHLTNFRKLRDFSCQFTSGLVAIRALNESGKSTLLEALAYALFGSDALREPLDDVVTWGEKPSSLKVEVEFSINTTKLRVTRGKSGAEIYADGQLVATGQKEVTRFIEGLLGAPPKVAGKLMLANQASLRGALSEGPTATAQLIEQLSNFALIDEIIQLVQEKLPCGNTAAAEQQVKTLAAQVAQGVPPALDTSASTAAVAAADEGLAEEAKELAAAKAELPAAAAAADAYRKNSRALEAAKTDEGQQTEAIAHAEAALGRLNPASTVSEEAVAAWRAELAGLAEEAQAKLAWSALQALVAPPQVWEGDRASFDAAVLGCQSQIKQVGEQIQRLTTECAVLTTQLIKETSCAFCSKDLRDVPEVVRLNSDLGRKIDAHDVVLKSLSHGLANLQVEAAAYAEIQAADRSHAEVFAAAARFIKLDTQTVPETWTWTGPVLRSDDPAPALKAKIEAGSAELLRAAQHKGQQEVQQAALQRAKTGLASAQALVVSLRALVDGNRSVGLETDLTTKVRYHEGRIQALNAEKAAALQAIKHAEEVHAVHVAAQQRAEAALKAASDQVHEMELNNVLLKKLRAARPTVADKLWATVLSTVSYYFSEIRGVQSVVSRTPEGFQVDGKPVPGLSGSTLDALGLAIRIALTKTFLPNNDFMILDEPGAACDEEREANMLGLVASAGFEQVLLVTHSRLADAFANQMVTL
jgi:DNA repair exonuclease SbcCD ATPase subunit